MMISSVGVEKRQRQLLIGKKYSSDITNIFSNSNSNSTIRKKNPPPPVPPRSPKTYALPSPTTTTSLSIEKPFILKKIPPPVPKKPDFLFPAKKSSNNNINLKNVISELNKNNNEERVGLRLFALLLSPSSNSENKLLLNLDSRKISPARDNILLVSPNTTPIIQNPSTTDRDIIFDFTDHNNNNNENGNGKCGIIIGRKNSRKNNNNFTRRKSLPTTFPAESHSSFSSSDNNSSSSYGAEAEHGSVSSPVENAKPLAPLLPPPPVPLLRKSIAEKANLSKSVGCLVNMEKKNLQIDQSQLTLLKFPVDKYIDMDVKSNNQIDPVDKIKKTIIITDNNNRESSVEFFSTISTVSSYSASVDNNNRNNISNSSRFINNRNRNNNILLNNFATEQSRRTVSVIERNARIIKWLYGCSKA